MISDHEVQLKDKGITPELVKGLNEKYHNLDPVERIKQLYKDFIPEDVMLTSSFAATSALFLKLFAEVNKDQEIYFIDTGYHFEETLTYRDKLSKKYGLKVIDVRAPEEFHRFTTEEQTWKKDPNFCCSVNKVQPLNEIKRRHRVWASGLMEWQSDHRSTLDIFEARGGILKFYPLLDVTREKRDEFIKDHKLPFHPLVKKGYWSIGCSHCTVPGEDRTGRWNNNPKTECGLHL